MNLQKLTKSIYISDQITTDDIDKLVTIGIKTIVNNRPDHEENNQPLSKDLEAYANNCGLIYYFIPIKIIVDICQHYINSIEITK